MSEIIKLMNAPRNPNFIDVNDSTEKELSEGARRLKHLGLDDLLEVKLKRGDGTTVNGENFDVCPPAANMVTYMEGQHEAASTETDSEKQAALFAELDFDKQTFRMMFANDPAHTQQ
jgi:hypothetical protein